MIASHRELEAERERDVVGRELPEGAKRSLRHHSVARRIGAWAAGISSPPRRPKRRAASTTGKKSSSRSGVPGSNVKTSA